MFFSYLLNITKHFVAIYTYKSSTPSTAKNYNKAEIPSDCINSKCMS